MIRLWGRLPNSPYPLRSRRSPDRATPVVYHSSEWGQEIVSDGEIRGAPIKVRDDLVHGREHHGVQGISTSRDFWFATLYAPCVFVLDWNRIRQRFRTIARAEGAYGEHDYRLESEELIVTPGLALERYCVAIWLDQGFYDDPESRGIMAHPLFAGMFAGGHR